MQNNQIKKIPKELSKLVNLSVLNLSRNQIKKIPIFKEDLWGACAETPAAYPIPIFKEDLWGACAETPAAYPIPIFKEDLWGACEETSTAYTISHKIGLPVNLRILDLCHNQIKEIQQITQLINLNEIQLHVNQINDISQEIKQFICLHEINFTY